MTTEQAYEAKLDAVEEAIEKTPELATIYSEMSIGEQIRYCAAIADDDSLYHRVVEYLA